MGLDTFNPSTVIAAIAGSISGLAFMPWEDMSKKKIALTIFVGFTCAMFVAPWLTHKLFGVNSETARTSAMVTYVTGVGSHIILPWLIRRVGRMLGERA